MSERLLVDREDGVFTITLNDPERKNPLSRELDLEIYEALRDARDTDARCIVLQGAGDAFSSGADIDDMGHDDTWEKPPHARQETIQGHEHKVPEEIITHPLPVISKIDGPAIGDGAAFALACDVPLASERARIGFSQARFGLTLDCAASYVLPRLVGRGLAMELALTGRIVDGERAKELGLVNHVFPDDEFEERAAEIVEEIATGPPVAHRHTKWLVRNSLDSSLDQALWNEANSQTIVGATEDYDEAAEALREGREPEFEGR
jgi:enoyl-CoA hydratase/carnithine racemase